MNSYQGLIKARNLIRKPNSWTKGQSMRKRANGVTAYCASGACNQVSGYSSPLYRQMMQFLKEATGCDREVILFNDHNIVTQKRAIAWFQRAIRRAAKAEGLTVNV